VAAPQGFIQVYNLCEGLGAVAFAWPPFDSGGWNTLLDLGKVGSFLLSILSLCALLDSAFFVPATRWEDRLIASVARVGFAGCICVISGLLFHLSQPGVSLARTLPVRLFLWAIAGLSLFFFLGWYLDAYYMPLFWRNLPH
jgi:hypothetical protein